MLYGVPTLPSAADPVMPSEAIAAEHFPASAIGVSQLPLVCMMAVSLLSQPGDRGGSLGAGGNGGFRGGVGGWGGGDGGGGDSILQMQDHVSMQVLGVLGFVSGFQ